ncbi:MAG: T9SS type A sorting domain-containing protein [Crocinitomicaceae bacterium]
MKKIAFLLSFVVASTMAVSQSISSVSPSTGDRGTYMLPVTITGTGTHFSSATSTIARFTQASNSLEIVSVDSVSNEYVALNVRIPNNASLGFYDVEVYDNTQPTLLNLPLGFNVGANASPPVLNAITPNTASINQTLPITISTQNTHFSQATDNFIYLTQGTNTTILPLSPVVALNDNYMKAQFNINYPGIAVGDLLSVAYGNSFDGMFYEPNAIVVAESTSINGIVDYSGTFTGIVELYHQNTNVTPTSYTLVEDSNVGPGGAYSFNNIAESSYLLRAVPIGMTDVVATYYPNDISWQTSTLVTTDTFPNATSYDITPFLSINLTGGATVNGTVGYGPNGFTRADDIVLAEGIEVFLKNETSSTYAQSVTDANGLYAFANVPDGNYTIVIDLPGYDQTTTYDFVVNSDNLQFTGLDFVIDEGRIFKTNTLYISDHNAPSLTVYPNPTTGELRIMLPSNLTDYQADIYSIVGQQIWSKTIQNNTSEMLKTDLSNFPIGVYIIKIKTSTDTYQVKVIKE